MESKLCYVCMEDEHPEFLITGICSCKLFIHAHCAIKCVQSFGFTCRSCKDEFVVFMREDLFYFPEQGIFPGMESDNNSIDGIVALESKLEILQRAIYMCHYSIAMNIIREFDATFYTLEEMHGLLSFNYSRFREIIRYKHSDVQTWYQIINYLTNKIDKIPNVCYLCHLDSTETLVKLSGCEHKFHFNCIRRWYIQGGPTCTKIHSLNCGTICVVHEDNKYDFKFNYDEPRISNIFDDIAIKCSVDVETMVLKNNDKTLKSTDRIYPGMTITVYNNTMKIHIHFLSGKKIVRNASPSTTVDELKSMIFRSEGIPINQQRLIFKGCELVAQESRVLGLYGITNDSIIHFVHIMRGN